MKYYIEITKEYAEELVRRGYSQKYLLMVDDSKSSRRHKHLLSCIEKATGVEQARIFSQDRTRYAVLARILYTHYARIAGDGTEQITRDLGRQRWATNFYLREYFSKIEGDKDFKRADLRLQTLLQDEANNCTADERKHDVGQICQNLLDEDEIAEKRQLKLKFK